MIYFDNSATTLKKPASVAEAAAWAIQHLGNAGRSVYGGGQQASRAIYAARCSVAQLAGLDDPMDVAFSSSATDSLNMIISALVTSKDAVITTVLEHNSVLRPLYRTGCTLDFVDCDGQGKLVLDNLTSLLRPGTRYFVCTHGSNVLGSISDIAAIHGFCRQHGLVLILDAAQTFGSIPLPAQAAALTAFTGHKALFGPQGTGGILVGPGAPQAVYKTGGTGADTFAHHQPLRSPDMFEAGTANAHGLYALNAGVRYILEAGQDAIQEKEAALTKRFIAGAAALPGLRLYGPQHDEERLPVVSLNIGAADSEEIALQLWEGWQIATRPGSHCAPLVHRRFSTENQGMVRFSFCWFNTETEIDTALAALKVLCARYR